MADFDEYQPSFSWLNKRNCKSSLSVLESSSSLSSSMIFRLRGSSPSSSSTSSSISLSPLMGNIVSFIFSIIIIYILCQTSYSLEKRLKQLQTKNKNKIIVNDCYNVDDNEEVNRITHYIIENVKVESSPDNIIDRLNTTNESDSDSSDKIFNRLEVYGLSSESPSNLSDITDEDCKEITNRLKSYGIPTSDSPNLSDITDEDCEFKLDDIDLKPAVLRKVTFI